MSGTIADLLPPGKEPPVPQTKTLADMLSEGGGVSSGGVSSGGVIDLAEAGKPTGDESPKKAETLSDLRAMYPELQDESSRFKVVVERLKPTHRNGAHIAGVLGEFSAHHEGNDILSIDGFKEAFGAGTYLIWVQGPSRSSSDPITGQPKILRKEKSEFKHVVPEDPMAYPPHPYQNPWGPPPPQNPHATAADVERVRGEASVMNRLVEHALSQDSSRPIDSGASHLASEALRTTTEHSARLTATLQDEVRELRRRNEELMERLSDTRNAPTNSANDEIVKTVLNRGTMEVEMVRQTYERTIENLRASSEDRIDRMRRDYEDKIARLTETFSAKEERAREHYEQNLQRERTMAEDRFRQERDHALRTLEMDRASFQRQVEADKAEYARNLQALRDDRDRDLSNIERQQQLLLSVKDTEVKRLQDELARVQEKLERLERETNKPIHMQLLEAKKIEELVLENAGGRVSDRDRDEEKEEKKDPMDKIAGLINTPGGMALVNALAPALAHTANRLAGVPAGAPPPQVAAPPGAGQAPPRQMGPGQPGQARPKRRQQQAPAPNEAPAPPPVPATPDPHRVLTKTQDPPMPPEQLHPLLSFLQTRLAEAALGNEPADPAAVGKELQAMVRGQLGGDMVSRFRDWIDAANLTRLLDVLNGKHGHWFARAGWVQDMWDAFCAEEAVAAAPEAAPQQQEPAPAEA